MKKILILITVIAGHTFCLLQAQPIFTVNYNDLSKENVTQLKSQISPEFNSGLESQILTLSLTKNKRDKEVYSLAFTSSEDTKIIILNEQTGNHITLTPVRASVAIFQLTPFFIEELRQGALGEAERFLIILGMLRATSLPDYSIQSLAYVSTSNGAVYLPRYFYGEKENAREAFPKDRQIVGISQMKPRLIPASPDDPESQRQVAQLAEDMSYYIYMFQLPDGARCTYDESATLNHPIPNPAPNPETLNSVKKKPLKKTFKKH
jgi:hypothetical protein